MLRWLAIVHDVAEISMHTSRTSHGATLHLWGGAVVAAFRRHLLLIFGFYRRCGERKKIKIKRKNRLVGDFLCDMI
jgi:hypothetical protein